MPLAADWNLANVRDPGTGPVTDLSHPGYPYEYDWAGGNPNGLFPVVSQYLDTIRPVFGLPALFASTATAEFSVPLVWLPFDTAEPARPLASFWVTDYHLPLEVPRALTRSLVFLAVQSQKKNDTAGVLGSRFGIRVFAHVPAAGGPPRRVRITGAACSAALGPALDPYSPGVINFLAHIFAHDLVVTNVFQTIRAGARFGGGRPLRLDGVRVQGAAGGRTLIDVYVNALRPADEPDEPAYALTARFAVDAAGGATLVALDKAPLVVHAAGAASVPAKLFPHDPASMAGPARIVDARPSRGPARLRKYWRNDSLPGLVDASPAPTPLIDDRGQVQVMQSSLAAKGADETKTVAVAPATVLHPRTNDFAALGAYQHARGLLDTIRGCGLHPAAFFRHAKLPLRVRYRATIKPGRGKSGRTINAQVDYDPPDTSTVGGGGGGAKGGGQEKPLQVRFALADLRHSRTRAEPLGLAADERWNWHEYCHVLLAAATGALELHFAHSAGDALAAILGDPDSALASPWSGGMTWDRGLTFPWVYLHRRHDRAVWSGWSWSGRFHRQSRLPLVGDNTKHKGYQSEQILSTSLFRVYRSLGGDTDDAMVRWGAAHYTAYLVMKAILLLGPAALMPAETPAQFVTALAAADAGTPRKTGGLLKDRVGGWAHKVVRWAFEQQGLYATTDPEAVIDAPGEPPDVDVFIDTRRPDSDGAHPRGGYAPVPLDWRAGAASAWHASNAAVVVHGDRVSVRVANRGPAPAANVTVRVWWIEWKKTGNPPPPDWDPGKWKRLLLGAGGVDKAAVPGGGATAFGPFTGAPTAPGRYLVLAEATCAEDPSNADPALSSLPCATGPTPLVDLVVGDNNLGLRLLDIR